MVDLEYVRESVSKSVCNDGATEWTLCFASKHPSLQAHWVENMSFVAVQLDHFVVFSHLLGADWAHVVGEHLRQFFAESIQYF